MNWLKSIIEGTEINLADGHFTENIRAQFKKGLRVSWPEDAYEKGRGHLTGMGFCQCNWFTEWVLKKPTTFTITDGINKITYTGVEWELLKDGRIHHSCPVEMTACNADVYFTYKEKIENG
jgi:hypothetical protein